MNKTFRKSQAAMEFLMTYGWAILVVLVAIGALAYFGVLSPDRFLPAKCTLPAGIACTDFTITAGALGAATVDIVLRNGLGFDIDPITITLPAGSPCDDALVSTLTLVADTTCPVGTTGLANGVMCRYSVTCLDAITVNSRFSSDVVVSYRNVDSNLDHDVRGTITGRAE